MTKYRMYVDEVGNADLKNASDENQRFLSLTGVILSLEHVQNFLNPQMENLKAKYFNSLSGLQLCDLIAHPSRREILLENKKIIDTRKDIFGDKISEILKSKYDSVKGKIYGKKLLP
ncbi:MAG: DUF3800 domain-containing protein [Leptospiraceae bacterium]|nr:DUF3800 domain-containing protein [Leptospiraceae bacterium]